MALRPDQFKNAASTWFYVALGGLCLIAVLFAVGTTARKWRTGPHASRIVKDYRDGTDEAVAKWKVVRNLIGSIEINNGLLALKRRLLIAAYLALGVEVAASIVVLVTVAR